MMMRFRFPIPARLLVGFVANLALLALGFWLVFRAQFGASSNQLFTSIAEPRVQAMVERLGVELRALPRSDWDRALETHSKELGVQFAIRDGEMQPIAGAKLELPEEVLKKIQGELTPHVADRQGGPPAGRPGPRPPTAEESAVFGEFSEFFGASFDGRFPPPRGGPPGGGPPPDGGPSDRRPGNPRPMDLNAVSYPKITAHTSNPSAYWVASRVPLAQAGRNWFPLIVIVRSTSLTAGGLFFDPKPWLYAGLGVLMLSALIWVPLALGLTRSLWRIRTATGRIAEGDFAVEVPDSERSDELGELGRSVKQMAQRLEGHVTGQKRFMGDIAHELCSPIARMQASLGILEQNSGSDEKQQRYLQRVSSELQHMSMLVNELLSFSKASLKREIALQPVRLTSLLKGVLQREDTDPGQFRVEVPDGMEVSADPELLGRAVGNLVRNALRYGSGSGPIDIVARQRETQVHLVVRDHGTGVPEEALPRLFDPFYRPDVSRTRDTGGAGLGLAIVKTCVEACGGTVSAHNGEGGGLEVILLLNSPARSV